MIEKITPRKLNTSKDARIQGAIEMYDAYNVSINDFTDSQDSSFSSGGAISGSETGDQGVIKPAKGNEKVANSLELTDTEAATTGHNRRIIGSVTDEVNGVIYCFLRSEEGTEHGVYKLDGDGLAPIFTSGHFNFPSNGFVDADIVYLKAGPVLYFTDGFNEPRKLHINKVSSLSGLSDTTDDFQIVDFITACPKTPMHRPSFAFDSDPNIGINFRNVQGFQFAYQCIYDTGEETALSPYSNVAVPPSYLNQGALSEPALQADNVIKVTVPHKLNGVPSFTNNVKKVRLLVRVGGRGPFFEVEEKEFFPDTADTFGGMGFEFSNDSVVTAIPQEDIDKLDDAVPKKAKAQAVVNDRLMYGNYTEGFDEKEKIECSLSVFYGDRKEEFTDLEISVKSLMVATGYDYGNNLNFDGDLNPSGGFNSDDSNPLIHNRRAGYQFDLSGLPSTIEANTEIRFKLSIRPERNFELYDSKNSFHAFKNVGYGAGQDNPDNLSKNDTTRTIKDHAGNDSEMPAVLQKNKGVVLDDLVWKIVAADGVPGVENETNPHSPGVDLPITTGHSPSCPFIIPSAAVTFALGLSFSEVIEGSAAVRGNISNALRNFFKNGDLTDDTNGSYTVDSSISIVSSASDHNPISQIDQGLNSVSGYGELNSTDPVIETIMQLFYRDNAEGISTGTHNLPVDELSPLGFAAINKAQIKSTLEFQENATAAVTGDNDVGPIFTLGFSELSGFGGSGKPEYTTMIPNVKVDGSLNWYWASPSYMASVGTANGPTTANQFRGELRQFTSTADFGFFDFESVSNLYFVLHHPIVNGGKYTQFFGPSGSSASYLYAGTGVDELANDWGNPTAFNESLPGGGSNYLIGGDQNDNPQYRLRNIGYVKVNTGGGLKITSQYNNFSENDEYQKYSIVDGEVNVRRRKTGNQLGQNFWYGFLHGTEYIGKQNNMFPLSRGWKGGENFNTFHGLFSYGNYVYGPIDNSLTGDEERLIINETFPDVEVRTFSYSQYGTGVSIDPQSRSFKRYCNHDFGVVFYDERGRPGNVNPLGSAYVDGYRGTQNATGAAFVVANFTTGTGNIPSWAHHYRMVYAGNSTIDDFIQYSAGGAFVPDASKNNDGLIYVSLNYLQENNLVSYSKAGGAVGADGDKDLYTYSAGDRLRVISYYNNEDDRIFVDEENHSFEVVGTVTLGDSDNPLVGENEDIHPAKKGQFVILKDNFKAQGFSFDDVLNSRGVNAGLNTSDIYDSSTNRWNRRCIFEIYTPTKSQSSEDRVYYEIGKTYNIIEAGGQSRAYQTPVVIMTEGDVFFRKAAVNLQKFENNAFLGLIGNGNGESDESIEPRFRSYYLESNTFTDRFPGADVKPFGKPRFISREKKEVTRESSIKFSDKANTESNVVRYTSFNNSKLPFKDLQNNDGPITSLLNFNDSLFCIQQLKCSSIPVARTIFSDALGQETVLGSSKVLGTEKYYAGTYGSSHPESVAHVDNTVYFASSDFNQVYRFNPSQGIEVISGKGMGSFFDFTLNVDKDGDNRIVGGYDPETDEFILSVNKNIDTFGYTNFSVLNQPSGQIVFDDVEGFTGSVDFIAGQISDAQIEILVGAVQNFGSALQLEQDILQDIIEGIGTLQGLLEEDFSAPASEGLSLELTIGDLTTQIGPFSNPSSYNAALQEIQNTAFVNLDTAVGQVLSSYEQADDAYDTLIRTIVPSIKSLKDQLEVLSALGSQVATLASGGGGSVVDTVASILETAGLTEEEQGDLADLLTSASNAATYGADLLSFWNNAQLTTVSPQDVIDLIFGSSDIVIPEEFLTVAPVSITYLDNAGVDDLGGSSAQGDNLGTMVELFAEQYQFVVSTVGSLDVSGALAELFDYLQTNIANEDGLIANLQTEITQLKRELYGEDEDEGGTGVNAGLYENFDALKKYAFGPDMKPIEIVDLNNFGGGLELTGNGQLSGDQGIEGNIKLLESQVAQISDGLAAVWDDYAQAYVDINSISGTAPIQTINVNGVSYSTEGYTTQVLNGYGSQYEGVGYATGIQQIVASIDGGDGSNPSDLLLIGELQQELSVRSTVYNQLVDAYLDPVFKDFDFGGSTTLVVNAYIAEVIDYMRKIIPSDELMISVYEKIYSLIINGVQTVPSNINTGVNPVIDSTWSWSDIDGNQESVEASLANTSLSEYKGVILEEMISDLGKIVQEAQAYRGGGSNNLAGGTISNPKNSVNTLTQWFKAYSKIRYSSPEAFDSYFSFQGDVEAFGNQTIETGGGGLSNFSQLINFFQNGQLTAEQIKRIIIGFTHNTGDADNLFFAYDSNKDEGVGSQDLLDFLTIFGQPIAGVSFEDIMAGVVGFEGAGVGNFPD